MWWTLISYSFSSLLWGLLMAVGLMAGLVLVVRLCCGQRRFVPLGYVALGVAFILLLMQTTLLCGALRVRNLVNDVEARVSGIVSENVSLVSSNLSQTDAGEAVEALVKEYPVLTSYVDAAALAGHTVEQVPHIVGDTIRASLSEFIHWRLFWGGLFLVLGVVALAMTARRMASSGAGWGEYDTSGETSYSSSYDSDYTPDYSYE